MRAIAIAKKKDSPYPWGGIPIQCLVVLSFPLSSKERKERRRVGDMFAVEHESGTIKDNVSSFAYIDANITKTAPKTSKSATVPKIRVRNVALEEVAGVEVEVEFWSTNCIDIP